MQLTRNRMKGAVLRSALGLMTANLLAAAANAQTPETVRVSSPASSSSAEQDFETGADLKSGLTRIDSAVLFYQEAGGRVKAIEPVMTATLNGSDGQTLSARFTYDSLTGASPNGATPWSSPQTFTTPAHAPGTTSTTTSASGRSVLVTIPGTGTVARQYTVPSGELPVDQGFQDQRYAIDLSYSRPLDETTRASIGGGYSHETDYQSYLANVGLSKDFNQHSTTLSATLNYEHDVSSPAFGIPTPLTQISGEVKGPDQTKDVVNLVAGVTQVMNRYWLAQLNYSVGQTTGYQSDPYRIISVVDPATGGPLQYLYESRPDSRLRQSIYFGNKIALGPTVLDLSARAYHDDWGIKSATLEVSDRVQFGPRFYVEPGVRYYKQTAADFFHNYLLGGQAVPEFASSDSRLDAFSAVSANLKFGFKFTPTNEVYLQVQDYKQTGDTNTSGAPGYLATQDLFSGSHATSVMLGLSVAFW